MGGGGLGSARGHQAGALTQTPDGKTPFCPHPGPKQVMGMGGLQAVGSGWAGGSGWFAAQVLRSPCGWSEHSLGFLRATPPSRA